MKRYTILVLLSLGTLSYAMDKEAKEAVAAQRSQEDLNAALVQAVCKGDVAQAEGLLKAGAHPNARFIDKTLKPLSRHISRHKTVLCQATEDKNVEMVRLLLFYQADPQQERVNYVRERIAGKLLTPLQIAITNRWYEGTELLLPLSEVPQQLQKKKEKELNILGEVFIFCPDAFLLFLQQGAMPYINKQVGKGTLVHELVRCYGGGEVSFRSPQQAKHLCCFGANLALKDVRGWTIYDILQNAEIYDISEIESEARYEDAMSKLAEIRGIITRHDKNNPAYADTTQAALRERDYREVGKEMIAVSPMAPSKRGNLCVQVLDRQHLLPSSKRAKALKVKAVAVHKKEGIEKE